MDLGRLIETTPAELSAYVDSLLKDREPAWDLVIRDQARAGELERRLALAVDWEAVDLETGGAA